MAFGVFAEDVDLDVEGGAGGEGVEAGGGVGVGDDCDLHHVANDRRYGETNALYSDGALGDDVAGEGIGKLDAEAPVCIGLVRRDGGKREQSGGAVNMPLYDVA